MFQAKLPAAGVPVLNLHFHVVKIVAGITLDPFKAQRGFLARAAVNHTVKRGGH